MKKVCFIIPALTGGGAERVFLNLLNHIDRSRFAPLVVLFERRGEMLADLPSELPVVTLKGSLSAYGLQWLVIFRFAAVLRKERPDVVVSFMSYTNLVALAAGLLSGVRNRIKFIVCERVSVFYPGGRLENIVRRIAIRFFYERAELVVVNAEKMGEELQREYGLPPSRMALIYNPVDISRLNLLSKESVDHPWYASELPVITAAGRLTRQKGFDYLIRALYLLTADGVNCRLVILGTGVEEPALRKLMSDLSLEDRVAFAGYQVNPYKYLARSTVFALSSRYEGFPNVLLEALALGVPSVATRCPTGPEELISDGENGLLVPPRDEVSLAAAIRKLLREKALRDRFSAAGKRRAEDFDVHSIVRQYEETIERVYGQ